ncbi:MAG: DUF4333 domain-containing protein [Solirubrobacterales bacterium]|nr:DUF4333 domain-containing protein [Solirubrobacterales bacterium]
MITSIRRVLVLFLGITALSLSLAACEKSVSIGDDTIASDQLELESSKSLTAKTGQKPASVDCPEDLKAEVDATETCELVDPQGNHYDMKVTVTSVDDDGNAKFNISVGQIKKLGDAPSPS